MFFSDDMFRFYSKEQEKKDDDVILIDMSDEEDDGATGAEDDKPKAKQGGSGTGSGGGGKGDGAADDLGMGGLRITEPTSLNTDNLAVESGDESTADEAKGDEFKGKPPSSVVVGNFAALASTLHARVHSRMRIK